MLSHDFHLVLEDGTQEKLGGESQCEERFQHEPGHGLGLRELGAGLLWLCLDKLSGRALEASRGQVGQSWRQEHNINAKLDRIEHLGMGGGCAAAWPAWSFPEPSHQNDGKEHVKGRLAPGRFSRNKVE